MKRISFLLFMLIPFIGISQKHNSESSIVEKEIQAAKIVSPEFQKANIFQVNANPTTADIAKQNSNGLVDAVYFDYIKPADFNNKANASANLTITVPTINKNQALVLDLVKVDIHSSDFVINVPYTQGHHYRGIVRDKGQSLVSISIFDDEVVGFVNYEGEALTLGKVKNETKTHVLYNEYKRLCAIEI